MEEHSKNMSDPLEAFLELSSPYHLYILITCSNVLKYFKTLFWGCPFCVHCFFSQPLAGLTNQVPVQDSQARAPLIQPAMNKFSLEKISPLWKY